MKWLARFAPPQGASPRAVRSVGLRNAVLGLLLVTFGVALILSLDRLSRGAMLGEPFARDAFSNPWARRGARPPLVRSLRFLSGVPVVIGFVVFSTGGYRTLTGIHPEHDRRGILGSLGRVALTSAIAGALLAAIVLVTLRR